MSDLYQHGKGGIYRLLHVAFLEATKEKMAVYQCLDNNMVYVRLMKEFNEKFTKLEPKESIDSHFPTQTINEFLKDKA